MRELGKKGGRSRARPGMGGKQLSASLRERLRASIDEDRLAQVLVTGLESESAKERLDVAKLVLAGDFEKAVVGRGAERDHQQGQGKDHAETQRVQEKVCQTILLTPAHPRESGDPGVFGLRPAFVGFRKNLGPRFRGDERCLGYARTHLAIFTQSHFRSLPMPKSREIHLVQRPTGAPERWQVRKQYGHDQRANRRRGAQQAKPFRSDV